jgi:hypothetical protein
MNRRNQRRVRRRTTNIQDQLVTTQEVGSSAERLPAPVCRLPPVSLRATTMGAHHSSSGCCFRTVRARTAGLGRRPGLALGGNRGPRSGHRHRSGVDRAAGPLARRTAAFELLERRRKDGQSTARLQRRRNDARQSHRNHDGAAVTTRRAEGAGRRRMAWPRSSRCPARVTRWRAGPGFCWRKASASAKSSPPLRQ